MRTVGGFDPSEHQSEVCPMPVIEPEAEWERVCTHMKTELGPEAYSSWFNSVRLHERVDHRAIISVPSPFRRDWIIAHYEDRLRFFWGRENPQVTTIEFVVGNQSHATNENVQPEQTKSPAPVTEEAKQAGRAPRQRNPERFSGSVAASRPAQQASAGNLARKPFDFEELGNLSLGTPLNARCTFDNFVTGPSNEWAVAAARQVANTGDVAFNPLYLYGHVGLGKTHLLQAIAWELRLRFPGRRVLYLSAEHFMYQFVRALRGKDMLAFKDVLRTVDVLLLDDIHFIANKASTQEEFFHTFDALIGRNHQIVVSAKVPPSDLCGIDEPIRSRLEQGLSVLIKPTNYDLRLGILKQKVGLVRRDSTHPLDIPDEVIQFLARRCVDNVRLLEGALNRLVAQTELVGRPISLAMTKEVLSDLLRSTERRITIDEIQRCVADYFQLRMADMLSSRRPREIVRPRQIAMYLCKQLTTRSLPEIGRKFGNRDHTTVLHAVRKIDELRQNDKRIDDDVDQLSRRLAA